jgi:glycosyltransferase involved in cell wall biosynthesis
MLNFGSWNYRRNENLSGSGDSRLLKILHIDPERNWGGGEAQVLGLLTYLAGRGHRNDLLADPDGALFNRCRKIDVRLHSLAMRNDLDLRVVPTLRRLIRAEGYDIVHFHTKRAHALSLWLGRTGNRPKFVVTRRMDYPERPGWYTNCLYNRRVDGVVAISQAIGDLLEQSGVEARRIRRISSGIEPQRFEACAPKRTASNAIKVIGCLAGLEERKGHQFLLGAAALLKSEGLNLRYRIAGEGPRRAHLEQEAIRLGLRDEVDFMGFVENTADFLLSVDLLVMPSLSEGLGVAVLEAMAARKAVVATRVGGLTESVIDGVTGILVAPKNARALAEAIAKLVREPALADEMGGRGRERVLQHFTLERMAMQNESYYYELLRPGT